MVVSEGPPIRSGIARTITSLSDGLKARGHQVDIISYPRIPRATLGEVRLSGLIFFLLRQARQLDQYDVIHLHGAAPTISDLFFLFARLHRLRPVFVYTHHCDIQVGPIDLLNRVYNATHHRLSNGADEVVSTTLGYAAEIGADGKSSIIPLGVDLGRFAADGCKDSQFTALFVGQFRPYKGAEILLRAAAQVHGMRLLMAGHGSAEHAYRGLAADLGVDVEFHVGADDDQLRDLYKRAHVIVLPSVTRAEAFGLVLLEGMAAGCVPVASDLPGVREVLGRIGFTFPPSSIHALASTLRGLRDNPSLVEQIAGRARGRAATFTWERTIADYDYLFQSLVAVRTLRQRLVERDSDAPDALHSFVLEAAEITNARSVDILLQVGKSEVLRVASSTETLPSVVAEADPVLTLLARYVCDTGESVRLGQGSAPRSLVEQLQGCDRSTIAAPLTIRGQHIGAMLATCGRPFDDRELNSLTRLARHTAPVLRTWQEYEEYAGLAGSARPYRRQSRPLAPGSILSAMSIATPPTRPRSGSIQRSPPTRSAEPADGDSIGRVFAQSRAALARRADQPPLRADRSTRSNWARPAIVALGLGILTLLLHGYRLEQAPDLFADEGLYYIVGANVARGRGLTDLFGALFFWHPPLYMLVEALFLKLRGLEFGDPLVAVLALRQINVVYSALTAICLYLLGRRLHSERAGLLMAALFIIDPYIQRINRRNMLEDPGDAAGARERLLLLHAGRPSEPLAAARGWGELWTGDHDQGAAGGRLGGLPALCALDAPLTAWRRSPCCCNREPRLRHLSALDVRHWTRWPISPVEAVRRHPLLRPVQLLYLDQAEPRPRLRPGGQHLRRVGCRQSQTRCWRSSGQATCYSGSAVC